MVVVSVSVLVDSARPAQSTVVSGASAARAAAARATAAAAARRGRVLI
jgi:hypothetical protein